MFSICIGSSSLVKNWNKGIKHAVFEETAIKNQHSFQLKKKQLHDSIKIRSIVCTPIRPFLLKHMHVGLHTALMCATTSDVIASCHVTPTVIIRRPYRPTAAVNCSHTKPDWKPQRDAVIFAAVAHRLLELPLRACSEREHRSQNFPSNYTLANKLANSLWNITRLDCQKLYTVLENLSEWQDILQLSD